MGNLIEIYIAFSFSFGFVLGPENFGKRHLVAEFLQITGGFGFLFFPVLYISEEFHLVDIWWNHLIIPHYPVMIIGAALAFIYRYFSKHY